MNQSSLERYQSRLFHAAILAIIAVRVWFMAKFPVCAVPAAGHDDAHFLNQAIHLLREVWLGPYNELTLAKGAFYPIFIAGNHHLGMPLILTQHLLYLGAGWYLATVLRRLGVRIIALWVFFAIYAFHPMSTAEEALRLLREYFYTGLSVWVLALLLSTIEAVHRSMTLTVLRGLAFGVVLGLFWITREEGIWILPAVFTLALLSPWASVPGGKFSRKKLLAGAVVAAVAFQLPLSKIRSLNEEYYGIRVLTEFQESNFVAAYGALARVEQDSFERYNHVPLAVREKVYAVSPTFSAVRNQVEGSRWKRGQPDFNTHFMWAFREAVAQAGFHESATKANEFYGRLADEINQACDSGHLECGPRRNTLAPILRKQYFRPFFDSLAEEMKFVLRLETLPPAHSINLISRERLQTWRDITGHPEMGPALTRRVSGWAFMPGPPLQIAVRTTVPVPSVEYFPNLPSLDVYRNVKPPNTRKDDLSFESGRVARFDVLTTCVSKCELVLSRAGEEIATAPIETPRFPQQWDSLPLTVWIDQNQLISEGMPLLLDWRLAYLSDVYQRYVRFAVQVVSLAAFAWIAAIGILLLRRRKPDLIHLFGTAALVAALSRMMLLAFMEVASFPVILANYNLPTYPMVWIFAFVMLSRPGWFFQGLRKP